MAQSTGTSVTATTSDISSEKTTTTDSCLNMMLEMPDRKNSGMNTAMWVRIEATIADQTSSLPSMAAVSRSFPFSMWRKVFSSTTIEASTTMPMPRARPPKVIVLSV